MSVIANHIAPKLSELDELVISYVPPGGNWKDVPVSVPSARLEQIRTSYAAGKGSRSTYYGRLLEHDSAYTISTYFTRPGNGCNIHYQQNRTLSYREAARLQSFPDDFEFLGPKTAVANQIGNAVPPLLAFQIAKSIQIEKVAFLDLFAGAGGMTLGLSWAGWHPIVSNDIDKYALETHARNFSSPTILGDITDSKIKAKILEKVAEFMSNNPEFKLFVVGGPPCQGFSTANGSRSVSDARNWLFKEYIDLVHKLEPAGVLFENVPGILSLEKGEFFSRIQGDLSGLVENVKVFKLNAAEYGVPQRRNRVIIIGGSNALMDSFEIPVLTRSPKVLRRENRGISAPAGNAAITVGEALSDLPQLEQSQDGTHLPYLCKPKTNFQRLMRGKISPEEFIVSPR